MTSVDLDDEERRVLRAVTEQAYRDQDREVFESGPGNDPDYPLVARRRLETLAKLLVKLGSSPEVAMKAIRG